VKRCRAALAFATLCLFAGTARAEDYRRPGLEGKWSRRHLTAPMNSLRIIAGPGQPMLLGQRYAEQNVDGGPQFLKRSGADDEWWLRGGVGFGLTKDWEAGALFLPFKFAPDFEFAQITVFVTRGFRFESVDLGLRLSFQTPRINEDSLRVWVLNPGVPLLYRSEWFRLDTGVFVPFATRDWSVGLTVPVRASVSVTPHVFFGLESGFAQARFDQRTSQIPLGALAGYTALFGSRVVDFTAQFSWDSFVSPTSPDSGDTLDVKSYRVGLGVVMHSLVR
jgi:hypothetical protein